MLKNCLTCGKEFQTFPSKIKKGYGKYCSHKCRRYTSEAKIRMSNAHKGRKRPEISGRNHPMWRKKHSPKTKRRMSEANKGSKNPSWKGGKIIHDGYVLINNPDHPSASNGYVLEHRLIIEKQIGRYLTPQETVHHRGKKDDNRPHLLIAFISNPVHMRFHKNPNKVRPEEIIFDGRKN